MSGDVWATGTAEGNMARVDLRFRTRPLLGDCHVPHTGTADSDAVTSVGQRGSMLAGHLC